MSNTMICTYFFSSTLSGEYRDVSRTNSHWQHPPRRLWQSPPTLLWQLAAASIVMATGWERARQGKASHARRGPGDTYQTYKPAHLLTASHRHHTGWPRQVSLQKEELTSPQEAWFKFKALAQKLFVPEKFIFFLKHWKSFNGFRFYWITWSDQKYLRFGASE